MPNEQPTVPVAEHCGPGPKVAAWVFGVLFLVCAGLAAFLWMRAGVMQQQLNALETSVQRLNNEKVALEGTVDALEGENERLEGEVEETEEVDTEYEDNFLSFEYPEGVRTSFQAAAETGRSGRTLRFWTEAQDGTLRSTGLELVYPEQLTADDGGETISDVRAHWEAQEVEMQEYSPQGRSAFKVTTGDLSGDTFTLYIPFGAEDSGDSYQFHGAFLDETVTDRIIDRFMETVAFKDAETTE